MDYLLFEQDYSDGHYSAEAGMPLAQSMCRVMSVQSSQPIIYEVTCMDIQLKALLDREEIRTLRTLYAHHLDSNNIAALDQVFSADAVVEVTVGKMQGIDAIRAGLNDAFTLFDRDRQGSYPFLHAIANHWVKLTGPDTAQGRCYLIDFETASKADPNPLLLLGLYADEYRRIDGQWRITHTRLEVVWPQRNSSREQDDARPEGA